MVRSRFVLPLALLALTGCQYFRANERAALAVILPSCPVGAVLSDAVTITKLRPGTAATPLPDRSNVILSAEMAKPDLVCTFSPKDNHLTVDVAFNVKAVRGPAASGGDPPLDFFVAIVDVENNVLVKKVYQYQPNLGGNQAIQWKQNVKGIAVPVEMDHRPTDYEILTGFQLTPAELAFNRVPKTVPLGNP